MCHSVKTVKALPPKKGARYERVIATCPHGTRQLYCRQRRSGRWWRWAERLGPRGTFGRRWVEGVEIPEAQVPEEVIEAAFVAWAKAQPKPKPKRDMVAERAAKAKADLERWTKKLKLAQTKVKKLRRRVANGEAQRGVTMKRKIRIESVRIDWSEGIPLGPPDEKFVRAVAEVSYASHGCRRLETFTSGGCGGVVPGNDYAAEVEADELHDLRAHLEVFGVDVSDFWAKAGRRVPK